MVFRHRKTTLVYWGSFGEVVVIFQLLSSVTQFSWHYIAGMIPNDGGKLEISQSTHFSFPLFCYLCSVESWIYYVTACILDVFKMESRYYRCEAYL